jgi:ATP-dependent protease Clp ATPase subunit
VLALANVDFEAVRKRIGWAGLGCAFCGRGGLDVGKLIAGPGLYVCDRCVGDATALVTGTADQRGTLALVAIDEQATCNFCGKAHTEANRVAAGPSARICRECLDLCREILAES